MRVIIGLQGSERKGASTSEMGRFETEFLTQEDNLKRLAGMNTRWVERAIAHTLHRRVILDMDSSESPVHGQQEGAAYNGPRLIGVFVFTPSFCSTSSGIVKQRSYDQATSTVPMIGKKSWIRLWSVI